MVNNFAPKTKVFEASCDVDPNRSEEFYPYSSSTELFPLGRKRCAKHSSLLRWLPRLLYRARYHTLARLV